MSYAPRSLHTTEEEVDFTDSVVSKVKNEAGAYHNAIPASSYYLMYF